MPDFESLVLSNMGDLKSAIDEVRRNQLTVNAMYDARLDALKTTLLERHAEIAVEIAQIKIKASLLGLIAGALPTLAAVLYSALK